MPQKPSTRILEIIKNGEEVLHAVIKYLDEQYEHEQKVVKERMRIAAEELGGLLCLECGFEYRNGHSFECKLYQPTKNPSL